MSANRAAGSPTGSIYDLGYRHYEGRLNGRLYAAWSLFVESLRGVWGFGRPATSKAAPFILAGLYLLPAAIQLAFASVFAQEISQGQGVELLSYESYFFVNGMYIFIILFCVAQGPEVVCRDQRYSVLPLYFTRTLRRFDYAATKLAALSAAIFIVLIVPMVVLLIGDVLMKADTFKAIGDELPRALPAIPASLLIAVSMASISLALSSFTPRRAYAAVGLVAYFLLMESVPLAVYNIGRNAGWGWSDNLVLLTPIGTLGAALDWFFGRSIDVGRFPSSLSTEVYVLASLASIVVFGAILVTRYRRVSA